MKTRVEFRSDQFPPCEGEERLINPGRWGKQLAEYLAIRLNDHGIETEKIYAEDWGWAIPVKNELFATWIGCGHQDGDENQFLCFIEPSKPVVRKLFKKVDTIEAVNRLFHALNDILTADPGISAVRWLDESEP